MRVKPDLPVSVQPAVEKCVSYEAPEGKVPEDFALVAVERVGKSRKPLCVFAYMQKGFCQTLSPPPFKALEGSHLVVECHRFGQGVSIW